MITSRTGSLVIPGLIGPQALAYSLWKAAATHLPTYTIDDRLKELRNKSKRIKSSLKAVSSLRINREIFVAVAATRDMCYYLKLGIEILPITQIVIIV